MNITGKILGLNRWIKLLSGTLLCATVILLIFHFNLEESLLTRHSIILLAMPGAYALTGLIEIITGVPFMEIARKWDDLAGWQRGVLGVIIVVLSFLLIFYGVVLFII